MNDNDQPQDKAVIDLMKLRRKRGETQVLLCRNCMDDTCFLPVTMIGKNDETFIAGLLCVGPKCPDGGSYTEIINGVIKQ